MKEIQIEETMDPRACASAMDSAASLTTAAGAPGHPGRPHHLLASAMSVSRLGGLVPTVVGGGRNGGGEGGGFRRPGARG